eukprot:6187572-Pleurochrysis_carterae.AAC.2
MLRVVVRGWRAVPVCRAALVGARFVGCGDGGRGLGGSGDGGRSGAAIETSRLRSVISLLWCPPALLQDGEECALVRLRIAPPGGDCPARVTEWLSLFVLSPRTTHRAQQQLRVHAVAKAPPRTSHVIRRQCNPTLATGIALNERPRSLV